MFCDIEVSHRRPISAGGLKRALGALAQDEILPGERAYAETELYRLERPPRQLFAFNVHDCVVIALSTSFKSSRYHLEGRGAAFTVEKLFQSAEKFSYDLVEVAKKSGVDDTYRVKKVTIQMLQGLGGDTRIEGKLLTVWPALKEGLDFKALLSSASTFTTALFLLWVGVKEQPLKAVGISFAVAIAFTLLEALFGYWWSGGKMRWVLRVP